MEGEEVPVIETKDLANIEKEEPKKSHSLLFPVKEKVYNIVFEFIPKEKNIIIKINDSDPKISSIYSVCLSLKDWNKLAPDPSLFKDILVIYKELEKIEKYNCSLNLHDNSLDLEIKLREYNYKPINISLTEEKNKEEDLTPNKIIEDNLDFKKENKRLEEKVKYLEKEIELLKSFLPYYLDKSLFQKLKSSQIIKDLLQLELINRGIYNLFQKNIKDIILKYEFKAEDNNSLSFFINNFNILTNVLLVVKTTEYRSFGAFYQIYRNYYNYNMTQQFPTQNVEMREFRTPYGVKAFSQIIQYNINIDPIQYPNSFFFSLDNLKIYNSNNSQFSFSENPSFTIQYNNNKKHFCGIEKKSIKIDLILQKLSPHLGLELNSIHSNNTTNHNYSNYSYNTTKNTNSNYSYNTTNNTNSNYSYNTTKNANSNYSYNTTDKIKIDHSFILSNQEQFENFNLEIYEIKV